MDMTQQHTALRDALLALRDGDFTLKIATENGDGSPELAEAAAAYNDVVDLLNNLASEFTRIAREVGTEGRFGGQAELPGARGTWADLRDNVNTMSANLTNQVRDLSQTVRAAVDGKPPRPITCGAQGETRELFDGVTALTAKGSGSG